MLGLLLLHHHVLTCAHRVRELVDQKMSQNFDANILAQALGGGGGGGSRGQPFAPPPTDAASVGKALGHISEESMLHQEMESLANDIERRNMRPMQRQAYLCSAACCEDEGSSSQDLQRCMQMCSLPVQRANNVFQNEVQRFQSRIQRCAMDCKDLARDEQGRAVEENVIQQNFSHCTERCFGRARSSVPDLRQRLEMMMAQNNSS